MDKTITFITGNVGKAEQLSKYLGINVSHTKIDLIEIQSLDLVEIVTAKVKEAYGHVGSAVIVDDVSLVINSMGKLPGPFIKFFIQELGNSGICKLVSNYKDKSAKAEVCIGYFDGENLEVFHGEIEGIIADIPKGTNGFGWDEILIPNGYNQTRSEMNELDYEATNPRKIALDKFSEFLSGVSERVSIKDMFYAR